MSPFRSHQSDFKHSGGFVHPNSKIPSLRFSDLSPARKRFIQIIEGMAFGRFQNLVIRGGDPQWNPPPLIIICPGPTRRRRQPRASDATVLVDEFLLLFEDMSRRRNGGLRELIIRDGLPFRW